MLDCKALIITNPFKHPFILNESYIEGYKTFSIRKLMHGYEKYFMRLCRIYTSCINLHINLLT